MQTMPYFMTNSKWFYFDGRRFVLTDEAPAEARKSLVEYYEAEEKMGYGG